MPSQHSGLIVSLNGGRGLVSRLAALGFVPGARVSMVQNYGHGPLIVMVRQARVALGRGEAMKILVQQEA
jgi:ferrous iron transport protein A